MGSHEDIHKHLLTRRQTLGAAGAAGAGILLAGPGGALLRAGHSEAELAEAAKN